MIPQFYKRLLDHAHDLIWAIDMEGKFIYINDNIREWGYDKDELIGQPLLNILNTKQIGKRYSEPSKLGVKRIFEMEVLDKNGKAHMVEVSSSLLHDDNEQIIGIMGIIRDITENQGLIERLKNEERLASLGRLASGIAHEIRNPLSSVKMNLAILMNRLQPKDIDREHFLIAEKEVLTIESIVNEMLEYAKPIPLQLKRTHIKPIVHDALETLRGYITEEIVIEELYDPTLPLVMVDKAKMRQVFVNLIMNAIQSGEGKRCIKIGAHPVKKGLNQMISIFVQDDGDGISEQHQPFIFDPFFTSKKSGTGLGLSIVKHIVDSHDGTITIESRVKEGTTIAITLPTLGGPTNRSPMAR